MTRSPILGLNKFTTNPYCEEISHKRRWCWEGNRSPSFPSAHTLLPQAWHHHPTGTLLLMCTHSMRIKPWKCNKIMFGTCKVDTGKPQGTGLWGSAPVMCTMPQTSDQKSVAIQISSAESALTRFITLQGNPSVCCLVCMAHIQNIYHIYHMCTEKAICATHLKHLPHSTGSCLAESDHQN